MSEDLEQFAARFAAQAIPLQEWTHLAHLKIGLWHVNRYGAEGALARLRVGIRLLNDANGVLNTPSGGYHETITCAYVMLLSEFLEACPKDMPMSERVKRLTASPLADKNILLSFYSREKLISALARAKWVEPDIAPLRIVMNPERPVAS
jgi:hypothetical protein